MVVYQFDCSTIEPYKGTCHTSIPQLGARRGHPKIELCLNRATQPDLIQDICRLDGNTARWGGGRLDNLSLSGITVQGIAREQRHPGDWGNQATAPKTSGLSLTPKQQKAEGSRNSDDQEDQRRERRKPFRRQPNGPQISINCLEFPFHFCSHSHFENNNFSNKVMYYGGGI